MNTPSNKIVACLIAFSLTFGFLWFDLPGHSVTFASQNAMLDANAANGHALYLLGMLVIVALEALCPRWFERHAALSLAGSFALGTLSLVGFSFADSALLCTSSVVLMGFSNVLLLNTAIVSLLVYVCERASQMLVIVGALAAKTVVLYLADAYLEETALVAFLLALPALASGFAATALRFITPQMRMLGDARIKFHRPFSTVMLGMLLFSSVIFATTRIVSNVGFWGTEFALARWGLIGNLAMGALYLAVSYLMLVRADSRLLFRFLPAFSLLFLVYTFLYTNLGSSFEFSEASLGGIAQYAELYGQAFAWAIILLAIRTLTMPAYRVVGIQFCLYVVIEILMQYCLIVFPSAASFIVVLPFLTALALLIWALCHFYGSGGLDQELKNTAPERAQANSETEDRLHAEEQSPELGASAASGVQAPSLGQPSQTALLDTLAAQTERKRALATAHGLSQRETDVFLLLAQGRSRKFICDELFIADGTASSYISRVYEKFGVHSKQELLSAVLDQPF